MADTFGGLTIAPVPTPGAGDVLSDPALDIVGDYLKAVINDRLGTAWNAVVPGLNGNDEDPVRFVFKHDPQSGEFNQKHLPALYIWRADIKNEVLADEWECQRTMLRMLWVLPSVPQRKLVTRAPILRGFAAVVDAAIRNTRDAAYVMAGDSDPTAATRGSVVQTVACIAQWKPMGAEPSELRIEVTDEGGRIEQRLEYPAIAASVEILERLTRDPSAYAGGATAAELHADFIVSDDANGDWILQDTTQDS